MTWEFAFLDWIQDVFHHEILDAFFPMITAFGDAGIGWILLTLLLLLIPKCRKAGLASAIALLLMLLINNLLLKPWIARVRPYDVLTEIQLLIEAPSDFSFPSGHTAASFASATALFLCSRKWGWPALVLAALIAFSRLYLYVHYPTDVLGGMVVGVGCGVLGWLLSGRLQNRRTASRSAGAKSRKTK